MTCSHVFVETKKKFIYDVESRIVVARGNRGRSEKEYHNIVTYENGALIFYCTVQ
jgi:hypothetical protein